MKNVSKIVFVILATLIGAGFASGKEIYAFFFIYGKIGLLGIIISSLIISAVTYKVLKICEKNDIKTYKKFCEHLGNRNIHSKATWLVEILNNVVNIFLVITFYIMISGFSSLLKQEFGFNEILGSIIILSLCYLIFRNSIEGLIKISDCLVPILIVFLLYISSKDIKIAENYYNVFGANGYLTESNMPIYIGIIKSVLYACYNCIILIPILIPLSKNVENKKHIIIISAVTFIILSTLSFAIYNLLLQGNLNIYNLEMPIIGVVKKYGLIYKNVYIAIIAISIFTSAVSKGCSVLSNTSTSNRSYKWHSMLMCLTATFVSQISFSSLVELLYPILGIFGVFEVCVLSRKWDDLW